MEAPDVEEKSASSSSSAAAPGQAAQGSLTSRRAVVPRRASGALSARGATDKDAYSAHAPYVDSADGVRTLRGVGVGLRDVIPSVPVRSTPFELDAALANLEAQLTGIGGSSAGSFPPTNFYIQWPPEETAERAAYKNNWVSPRDLLVAQTPRTKTARDFPRMLGIHEQRHQAGLMGFAGDLPLAESGPGSSRVGGHAAKWFTGRAVNEHMADSKTTFTGAKPKTAGERSQTEDRNVGPGSYDGPMTSAVLSRSTNTFKPKPPKRFDDLGLIQGPAPGSYNPSPPAARVPALHFGGTQKTHSRVSGAMAHQTGLVGSDPGGPGSYDQKEAVFGGEPTSLIFGRAARFADPSGASNIGQAIGAPIAHAPGPGQYNISGSAVGAIGASGRDIVSFAARGGGGSAAAAAVSFKRSLGPAVGSYNPQDGLDIGSATVGSGHTVSTPKPLHKFASSPRFPYHSRPHPLYALVISSAKQRSTELVRNFAPDLDAFRAGRREQLLEQAKQQRKERQRSASTRRLALSTEHLAAVDRIVHADEHRAAQREAHAIREFEAFVRRGWLFYIALAARTQLIKENVRRVRTAKNLRLLTTNAARTIVTYARKWAAKARAKKVLRCAHIILRALRRNVVRASLRRKRRAIRLLTILLLNRTNKVRALLAIARCRAQAVVIQRVVRAFLLRKQCGHALLTRQWCAAESLLASKYKSQEGEKAFEKIRKKGLLLKALTVEQQRARIVAEVPFDLIEPRLRDEAIEEDYHLRLRAHRHALYEWRRLKRRHDGLPEQVSIVDQAIAAKAQQAAEAQARAQQLSAMAGITITAQNLPPVHSQTRMQQQQQQLASMQQQASRPVPATSPSPSLSPSPPPQQQQSPTIAAWNLSASYAAAALASGLPPPPPFDPRVEPRFPRLITPLRLYMLITNAQQRQAAATAEALGVPVQNVLDVDVKRKYKQIIGAVLRQHAAREAKEKRARERLKEKEQRERDGLPLSASGPGTPHSARSPAPPPRRTLPAGSSSARRQNR